jgi:hypothetical protein
MLSAVEYPHWLMVAGAVLVVFGFVGIAFLRSNAEPAEDDNLEQEVAPRQERAQLRSRLTQGPPEFREDRVDRPKAKGMQNLSLLLGVAIGLFGALPKTQTTNGPRKRMPASNP